MKRINLLILLFLLCLIYIFAFSQKIYFFIFTFYALTVYLFILVILVLVWVLSLAIRSIRLKSKYISIITKFGILSLIILIFGIFMLRFFNRIRFLELEDLKSVPYASWTSSKKSIQDLGVTRNQQDKSYRGINIFCSHNLPEAYLMDMSGRILHTWSNKTMVGNWVFTRMLADGDLLVIENITRLLRLDWNSNVKWEKSMCCHHSIYVSGNGDIYVPSLKVRIVFKNLFPVLITDDRIVVLSEQGSIKSDFSIYDIIKTEVPLEVFFRSYAELFRPWLIKITFMGLPLINPGHLDPFELFHNNSAELIERDIPGICRKGNLLISLRELNLIVIFDTEKKKITWEWGPGDLRAQHQPTLLENNNILLFDNGGERGYSRVIEVNPFTKKIVWEYKANPPVEFYSENMGGNQRLPNGNTLITDSESGHAFEVTKDRQKVWEFYNPRVDQKENKRETIYRLNRITDLGNYPVLESLKYNDK